MTATLPALFNGKLLVPDLVCIAESIDVLKDDSDFLVDKVFVNPTGIVVFEILSHLSGDQLSSLKRFVSELKLWTLSDLDDLALEYFYSKTGVAMLVIDAMCENGLRTYSDASYFRTAVRNCLKKQTFILIVNGVIVHGYEL